MGHLLDEPRRANLEVDAEEIEVTVVMPCLDEARTLGRCIDKARRGLDGLGVRHEVVVADNGSTDGSPEIARDRGGRVVHVERRGYGSAIEGGIAAARGRYVIMGDADDSYDFTRLGPFLERLRAGDDLVLGNRFRGGIRPGAMPWLHRYVGNPLLTGVLNLFFRSPVGDAHCGLRALRRAAHGRLGLVSPGMEYASEMVVKACLHRLRISEVPTTLDPDGRGRPPHLRRFRDGWRHLRLLMLLCPFWLYLVPAVALLTAGLSLMIWLTPGPRRLGPVVLDVHTMLFGALCVLLAVQVLWLWAFAKLFGWTSGLLPAGTFSLRVFNHFNLERGLLAGVVLLATGSILALGLIVRWSQRGLGPLDVQVTLRPALWALTTLVAGAQTIAGSFLLSMLGMVRGPRDRATT